MEKKQNKLLLASAVIGALFVVGVIIFWVFIFRESNFSMDVFITNLKDIFSFRDKKASLLSIGLILSMVSVFLSLIFNLIGWIKGNSRHILIAGILYVLGLNLLSAPLCFVEYFDEKRKIKNKLLFYTGIYTSIFGVLLTVLLVYAAMDVNDRTALIAYIYIISTVIAGVILNFIAWKTDNNKAKIAAGIAYIVNITAIISGVICFISARDFLKAIKNKLLFYAMVFALIWSAILIFGLIVSMSTRPEEGNIPLGLIYLILMGIAGFIINYFAWKTNNKKAKIIAGIVYIFGTANLVSAILCFISCKDNRKLPDAEEKATGSVDV
jgi:hypothetical protein